MLGHFLSRPRPSRAEQPAVTPTLEQLLDLRAVKATVGASRSTIYAWIAKGVFPRPLRLGPRRVAWRASDIRAWIESRPPT